MAKYAYVKKGLGTKTSAETKTALETGIAFGDTNLEAADVFADLYSVITNASLVDGDFVIFSDVHDAAYSVSTNITDIPSLTFISVDDTSVGIYLAGAKEKCSSTSTHLLVRGASGDNINSFGVDFGGGNRLDLGGPEGSLVLHDCNVTLTSGYIYAGSGLGGSYVQFNAVNIDVGSGYLRIGISGVIDIFGGSLTGTTHDTLIQHSGGGAIINLDSVDISSATAPNLFRANTVGQDNPAQTATRCKLPASINICQGDIIANKGTTIAVDASDDTDDYFDFETYKYTGIALPSTTVVRTGGATYDGANEISVELQPNSNVIEYIQPLRIKLGDYELDLTSANTLTFHLAMGDNVAAITPSTITNDKYWIEIVQNDDTPDNALGITINTKPTDILTTPSALANVPTTWVGLTLANQEYFQIPLTTEIAYGMTNGQVTAYLCVAEYVSTRVIFADPSPVVS